MKSMSHDGTGVVSASAPVLPGTDLGHSGHSPMIFAATADAGQLIAVLGARAREFDLSFVVSSFLDSGF